MALVVGRVVAPADEAVFGQTFRKPLAKDTADAKELVRLMRAKAQARLSPDVSPQDGDKQADVFGCCQSRPGVNS
jgi:hypothetical protein